MVAASGYHDMFRGKATKKSYTPVPNRRPRYELRQFSAPTALATLRGGRLGANCRSWTQAVLEPSPSWRRRTHMKTTRKYAAVLAATALLAVGGCSSGDGSGATSEQSEPAAEIGRAHV